MMENFNSDDLLEEIKNRQIRYKYLRYLYWLSAAVFFFLIADMFFLDILKLEVYGDYSTPVNAALFFAYAWGNLYFIHDFVTDKLGNFSNVSIAGKLGFLGWNIVCLGHLFGFIST